MCLVRAVDDLLHARELHGRHGPADDPVEGRVNRLAVRRRRGPVGVHVGISGQVVHEEVVVPRHDGGAPGCHLEVDDAQEAGLPAVAGYEQVEELRNLRELVRGRDAADEEDRLHTGVDAVEPRDAAVIPHAHAGVGRVVVPEGVVKVPEGGHLAVRHRLLRPEVEEALEVVPQEVHEALLLRSHPVEGQSLAAAAHVLEGQLGPAEAA
mmetsp:Transcript_54118/g.152480  ORF Transcript_54118/g.152480 Transcript_54118/m.152480 type:complete len:209 (+) Transcript_54118:1053-1679(+)